MVNMLNVAITIISIAWWSSSINVNSAHVFINPIVAETHLNAESRVSQNASSIMGLKLTDRPSMRAKRFSDSYIGFNLGGFNFDFSGSAITANAKQMEENFHEVFVTLDRNLHAIKNVQEAIDVIMTKRMDGFQSIHEGTKLSKEEIIAEINLANERVDRDFGYLLEIFIEASKSYNAVEKTRLEMLGEFHKSLVYAKNSRIERTLAKMNNFISYFTIEKAKISKLPRKDRIAILTEKNGFLQHLRETRMPSGDSIQTFLNEVIAKKYAIPQTADDHVAYAALSSMYYGVVTLITIQRYMIRVNIYVSDHYYRSRDLDNFNRQIDNMIGEFLSFRDTLIGKRGLIPDAISILKDAADKGFARNLEGSSPEELVKRLQFLEQEQLRLTYGISAVPIIQEVPGKLNGQLKFDSKSLFTPIGLWKDGAEVSYAVQYANTNGMLSKVGEWSEPFPVNGRANPRLKLPAKSTYTRLIFRKFDDEKPQLVGVYEPGRQGEIRDIDGDLFYTAGGPDESLAIVDATAFIGIGANAEATFDLGRSAIHAAAFNGNTDLAKRLLVNDSNLINVIDSNDYTPLHLAAEGGWADFVQMMLNRGSDINAKTKAGLTPLHLAVSNGYTDVAEVILQNKYVDVNAQDNNGAGPLHLAVLNGEETLLSALLANEKIDINLQSNGDLTPLHLSILMNSRETTERLIANSKARMNVRSHGNLTALHYAAISGNTLALQMLGDQDATDFHPQSVNGWTPLHYAVSTKRKDVISDLLELKHLSVDVPGASHITPLHLAAVTDQSEVIRGLLSHGARIDFQNSEGLTALHLAAINRNLRVLTTLMEMGADVNTNTRNGSTVLHLMAANGDLTAVKAILEKGQGVQINLQNNEGLTALHLAAVNYHKNVMEILLDKGADVNSRDRQGSTFLHIMATNGDLNAVKGILEKGQGVQINLENNDGLNPLHLAAINNHSAVMGILLDKGADANARNNQGSTVLHLAAAKGDLTAVKTILEKGQGVQVNLQNNDGLNPLHLAAVNNHYAVMGMLLDKGADANARNNQGSTVLHLAVAKGDLAAVKTILEKGQGVQLNLQNNEGQNPLHLVAVNYHKDVMEFLLDKGADVNSRDSQGSTFLHIMATNGDLAAVKTVLKKGRRVQMNLQNNEGLTALQLAAVNDHKDVTEILIQNGADVNSRNDQGSTYLHIMAANGNLAAVKSILEKGRVQINMQNNEGLTALHLAAGNNHNEVMEVLLEEGANVNSRNNQGSTVLHIMVTKGDLAAVKTIYEKGRGIIQSLQNNEGLSALHVAAVNNHTDVMALLLRNGALVNARNTMGSAVLHTMAAKRNLNAVKIILENGYLVNPNLRSDGGLTALHIAAVNGHIDMMGILLEKGADVNLRNDQGSTVLHIMAAKGDLTAVKLILGKGRRVLIDQQNREGLTALNLAAVNNNNEMMDILIAKGADVNSRKNQGSTFLHLMATKGDLSAVKSILEKGQRVQMNVQNKDGLTALHLAAVNNHNNVVGILLDKGADVNVRNVQGSTVLHEMAAKGNSATVKSLLEKGRTVQINLQNNEGLTALHLAAVNDHEDVMALLLQKGADFNAITMNGTTILNLTAGRDYRQLEQYNLGPDRSRDSLYKYEPFLKLAERGGHTKFAYSVRLMLKESSKGLIKACKDDECDLDIVKSLVVMGADIEYKDKGHHDYTVLMWAAWKGKLDVVTYLVESGAKIGAQDDEGWDAASIAVDRGRSDVGKYLKSQGAPCSKKCP